jgi:hypothetical protein
VPAATTSVETMILGQLGIQVGAPISGRCYQLRVSSCVFPRGGISQSTQLERRTRRCGRISQHSTAVLPLLSPSNCAVCFLLRACLLRFAALLDCAPKKKKKKAAEAARLENSCARHVEIQEIGFAQHSTGDWHIESERTGRSLLYLSWRLAGFG